MDEVTVYDHYFNMLIYLGVWKIESENPIIKLLYYTYSAAVSIFVIFMVYMGVLDLMESLEQGNINRIFFNTCFNPLIMATYIKLQQIVYNARRIMKLHNKLRRNEKNCQDEEEIEICKFAEKSFGSIAKFFYLVVLWLYPSWLYISMINEYWGERELPLPAKWPNTDISDLKTFILLSLFHGLFAVFYCLILVNVDVAMFGLLVEIRREYSLLIKKIRDFNAFSEEIYTEGEEINKNQTRGEINIFLKKKMAKEILGQIIHRQKELLEFTVDFEKSYNGALFTHIFVGGALLVCNGVQAMIVSSDYSIKMGYQFGYLFAIMMDMLFLCTLANEIHDKCNEVGTAFYSTCWYKMDIEIQKNIFFIILRSQKPPRITSGNFLELDRRALMVMIKNIYSWLALLRQVALK